MPIPTFTGMGPYPEFNDVVKKINTLVAELQNLMLSLDDANFSSITAQVIDVDQLSAITSDMGTLTAGIIYGAYIATANGTYPRIEFSSSGNLLSAFYDALNSVAIIPNFTGSPLFVGKTGTTIKGFMGDFSGLWSIYAITTALYVASNFDITIRPGTGYKVNFPNWTSVYNQSTSRTLQQDLDALSARLTAIGG
jgi:hypothetical protein